MRRIALVAVFQCFGIMAFCQSMTLTPGNLQPSPNKPLAPQPLFNFDSGQFLNGDQFGQISPSAKAGNPDFCDHLNAIQKQMSAQADLTQTSHVPCMNLKALPEVARLAMLAPQPLAGHRPHAHLQPIPTQWPDAKVEQTPTTWPNLKVEQIAKHVTGPVPAQ